MAERRSVIITPAPREIGLDTRQTRGKKIELRHLLEREIRHDRRRNVPALLSCTRHDPRDLLVGQRYDTAHALKHATDVLCERRCNGDAKHFLVIGEHATGRIENATAFRRQDLQIDPVLLGQWRVSASLENLQIE